MMIMELEVDREQLKGKINALTYFKYIDRAPDFLNYISTYIEYRYNM